MTHKKKNILAVSTIVAATLLSATGHAAPLAQPALSFPATTSTLLYGLSALPAPIGLFLTQGVSAGWQAASSVVSTSIWSSSTVAALMDKSLTTSAISAPRKPDAISKSRQTAEDVFGSVAIPFKKLGALKKAAPTFAQIAKGTALRCSGQNCLDVTGKVQQTSASGGLSSIRDRLNRVNHDVNKRIKYRKDIDVHGTLDRWASPSETLTLGAGDCEDYALLKMAVLESQGVSLSDMTVVILYDTKRHFYHAVLSVEVQGRHYILDNMREQVLTDRQLPDYMPLFSISNGRGFLHGMKTKGKALAMKSLDGIAPGEGGEL